ncbi:C40 family peptidase [Edwardsiella tarda]|uniref:C40 family peptidase n=1 Tax=Edwardsiella tarda TaxID=636 RepID=UPI0028526499|nr:Mov34/MPN/PAD-1 family protein [Edwardsiella tarda]UCQ16875.1 C40 family peptidase [Edwardsiella tarda]
MIVDEIIAYTSRCAPAEACGYVIRTQQGDIFLPVENSSIEPTQYFRMTPEDFLVAQTKGDVIALVHSHPDGPPHLSSADRLLQVQSALPWWLVCDGSIQRFRCVPPLLGRRFTHGVMDCYTLFQDAYHLAGIAMPDFSRKDDWWRHGENLYLDNMAATGFRQVKGTPQPGDIMLFCYGCSVANHAAIYCGGQTILHHLPNQLSKREELTGSWQRRMHSLWRHTAWQPSSFTGIYNDLAAEFHYRS